MRTKHSLLLLAGFFLAMNSYAQLEKPEGFIKNQVGIKVGINASQFYGEGASDNNESIFGYHGGAFARLMLSQSFAIQPELLYTTKGNVSPSPGSIKISNQYIVFDLLLKYYVSEIFNVHVGPELGYMLEAETKYDADPLDPREEDISEAFNELDYALVVGAELHLNEKLSLGLRYNPSFATLGKKLNDKFDFTEKKNTALLLFGTFAF